MLGLLAAAAVAFMVLEKKKMPVEVVQGWHANKPFTLSVRRLGRSPHRLALRAADAFDAMEAAALAEGVALQVNSAFRSYETQARFYSLFLLGKDTDGNPMAPGYVVAAPGWSNHQGGVAVDVESTEEAYTWLTKRATEFGFRRTVPTEKWHWEYQL